MKSLIITLTFALTCLAIVGCSQADADKKKTADIKAKDGGAGSAVKPAPTPNDEEADIKASLAKLPDADRKLAEAQKICPVLKDSLLGSMGVPVKVTIQDQPVFLCCKGCQKGALANPKKTLDEVAKLNAKNK